MLSRLSSLFTRLLAPLPLALACTLGACGSSTGSAPHALRDPFATTAFDSTRGVTVLFGGLDGSRAGETWEWDGTTWTLRATTGPSPRQGHAMAFDSARGVTVLFGGFEGSGHLSGETWEWDGSTWTLRAGGIGSPDPRQRHVMAYDPVHNVSLMFGGQDISRADGAFSNDLWQWEAQPRRWTRLSATGPSSRYLHAMVFDSARGVAVLFGGLVVGFAYAGDTWTWDGTAWTQVSTLTAPSPRAAHALAFDSTRNVAVLFGGYDGTFNRQTWEWDGSQWTEREATFSTPRLPSLVTRGFVLIDGAKDGARALPFQLEASASGMRGTLSGTR